MDSTPRLSVVHSFCARFGPLIYLFDAILDEGLQGSLFG